MYAVFADHIFEGLFRSRAAAERLIAELHTYPINWRQEPTIETCNEYSTFEHYTGYSAQGSAIHAIEWRHFGRRTIK